MAVGDIVNTFEGDSVQKQQSGSFYNGHKVINDPIHVNYNNLKKTTSIITLYLGPYYIGRLYSRIH